MNTSAMMRNLSTTRQSSCGVLATVPKTASVATLVSGQGGVFSLRGILTSPGGLRGYRRKQDAVDTKQPIDKKTKKKKKEPSQVENQKWAIPYSRMTKQDVQRRIGLRLEEIPVVPVKEMLDSMKYRPPHFIDDTKETVYKNMLQFIRIEAYPGVRNYKEASINDLVYITICPCIDDVIRETGRKKLGLLREKEVIGVEEFVTMDIISVWDERFVLIVESKMSQIESAKNQCLLSMWDMWQNNGAGEVYGFMSSGEEWRMVKYDGVKFIMTRSFKAMFEGMEKEKELWLTDYSVVVDTIIAALLCGGMIPNPQGTLA